MKRQEFLGAVAALAAAPLVAKSNLLHGGNGALPCAPWPEPDAQDESFWEFLRGQFPLARDRAYLNTGGLGASPYVVIEAVKAKMDELEKVCETGHDDPLLNSIKASAGVLLGCDAEEIAFVRNTTEGINIVANGLPFQKGDEVITTTHEHVGNAFTWLVLQKRAGIVLRFFEPSVVSAQENLDRIQKLITKKTRLISIPHAVTTTGLILPVREIAALAKSRNIRFFIDGAQTAGMVPFTLHEIGCDAYATSGHKWLMGPKETGLLYVRRDMLDTIQAKFVGAYSAGEFDFLKGTFALNPTAQRYEYGTVSVPLRVGLGAAVEFVRRIGIERIWARDRSLSTKLFEGLREIPDVTVLSPADAGMRSAMVTFMHARIPHLALQEHLNTYNLRTRSVTEGGLAALRVSTHVYNTFEEVERVLEGVRTAGKS
jgi:selenocysteine lyase/cysteine desulfurase